MLPSKALHELKELIARDYGVLISDDQAQELGVSVLRLTRVALAVRARELDSRARKVERPTDLSDNHEKTTCQNAATTTHESSRRRESKQSPTTRC